MKKKIKSPYFIALKDELAKSLSMLKQREILLDELNLFSAAIEAFAKEELKYNGRCKILSLSTACFEVGLKTIGEIYEVKFQLPGISAIRLITVTLAKTGVYPCSMRFGNTCELCKNLTEVRKVLANCCKICCFRIVEYASKAISSSETLSENIASMGGIGSNPKENCDSMRKISLDHRKRSKIGDSK